MHTDVVSFGGPNGTIQERIVQVAVVSDGATGAVPTMEDLVYWRALSSPAVEININKFRTG